MYQEPSWVSCKKGIHPKSPWTRPSAAFAVCVCLCVCVCVCDYTDSTGYWESFQENTTLDAFKKVF